MVAITDFWGNPLTVAGALRNVYNLANAVSNGITGSAGNDGFLLSNAAGITATGGNGDDSYYGVVSTTKIVETAGGGIDTVYVNSNYQMADHIENLVVGYAIGVTGNAQANQMVGSTMSQMIDGGRGNDVLTGGGGGDMFVFKAGSGYDLITDFHAGARVSSTAALDTVQLAGYSQFKTFGDVKAAMSQQGADVVLTLDSGNAIKFANTQLASFSADNFLLANAPTGLKLSFNEDFNGPLSATGGSSAAKWRTDYGWGGDSNAAMARNLPTGGEKQIYVDTAMKSATTGEAVGINPFSIKDGVLTIHAAPAATDMVDDLSGFKFTSGLLSTRNSFTQTYGYFEARMDLPAGSGAWPAFWLYTTTSNGSELDVMESHSGDTWTATTHDYATGKDTPASSAIFTPDLATGFHTYGVLWTAETVTWYLDGVAVRSQATPPDMHGPMYMMVNLALDATTASTFSGADLQVDYVRAYSLDNLPSSVVAGAGAETLNDTAGATTLVGLGGDDKYFVSSTATQVQEAANGGNDTVNAAINYTLTANVENLNLTGSAQTGTGNELNNVITGNDLNNTLRGLAGNDVLDGGKGADVLIGGLGNDSYVVDNVNDQVIELAGEGTDTVTASVDYTLTANVENLVLTGTAIRGTGNDLNNSITGNAQNNILTGGKGNDVIDGGVGADIMTGSAGNDLYIVDNVGDTVVEKANEGWDHVRAGVDYIAAANIEQVTLTGNAKRATANDTGTYITGNNLGNVLTGGKGADTLIGGTGADTISGGAGADRLTGGAGADMFVFAPGFGADTITDFAIGTDTIDWSALSGTPVITEANGAAVVTFGKDTITFLGVKADALKAAGVFAAPKSLAAERAEAIAPVTKVDNIVAPPTAAKPAAVQGQGFVGTAGNDTFTITALGDFVTETATGGIDTVRAAVDFTLSDHVEHLVLTGNAVSGTGNALANNLVGNALANTLNGGGGNDWIDGGAGADTMIGGAGNDGYVVDNADDRVVELANEGTDTVWASVDYVLGTNVENLQLTGNAVRGTGNELNNIISGNALQNWLFGGAGDDRLDGGAGADRLEGGTGNDSYIVDDAGDVVIEKAGEGWDQISSSVDYVAADNVESLLLTGSAIRATANAQGTALTGNAMDNILIGKGGRDTIKGGAGADIISGGGGDDTLTGGEGHDTFHFSGAFGKDTITDFNVREDRLDLSLLASFESTLVLTDTAQGAVARIGGQAITFTGVTAADLIKNHVFDGADAGFHFAPAIPDYALI